MSHTYEFARPSVTVDCVVFGVDGEALRVLLIQRKREPFAHRWALPGGFVRMDESLDTAARRELVEETGVHKLYLEQLYTFGEPTRDPRGRVISVAYYALVRLSDHAIAAATDAEDARWYAVDELPELAFDHQRIIELAHERLAAKVRYAPIGFELLPEEFTLSTLQRLYELVLRRPLDKRNFRKKILATELLSDTGHVEQGVAHRAARLYRFDRDKYQSLSAAGFAFAL